MSIRKQKRDPRTEAERGADEEVLANFESGKFLARRAGCEAVAIKRVQRAYETRRKLAAALGAQLGVFRRGKGMSQEQLAHVIGTRKSNISRVESGRYGGLSIERFLAILEALSESPADVLLGGRPRAALIHDTVLDQFGAPTDCLETADR